MRMIIGHDVLHGRTLSTQCFLVCLCYGGLCAGNIPFVAMSILGTQSHQSNVDRPMLISSYDVTQLSSLDVFIGHAQGSLM